MTVTSSIDPARLVEEQLAQASPDLLRELLTTFINTLMSAEADAVCGATYGSVSPDRTNRRNGYRGREYDTRAGTLALACRSCGRARISPTGCWSGASGPSGP
jgi:transposase-like protein